MADVEPVGRDAFAELAAHAAPFQRDPSTACAYISAEAAAIASELDGLPDEVIAMRSSDGSWIAGEIDTDVGRVWWIGPFVEHGDIADALYRAAAAALPEDVDEEELAADVANEFMAAFAARHGFSTDPASLALRRPANAPLPTLEQESMVEPMAEDVAAEVSALHEQAFPGGHYTGAGLLSSPRHDILVAREGGRAHGYVALEWQADGTAYVDFVGVREDARRRGLGSALVAAACRLARDQGATSVHLTVRETLSDVRRLYERLGFVVESALVPYRKGFTLDSQEDHP